VSTQNHTGTEHRRNLTKARKRVRDLHHATQPQQEIQYRGHTLKAENPEHRDAYQIQNDTGEVLFVVERSNFGNADDWLRVIDVVIQDGPAAARDYLGASELDEYVVSKNAISSKKRHRPGETTDGQPVPDCQTTAQDVESWTVKSRRQTIFYQDCARCFGGAGE